MIGLILIVGRPLSQYLDELVFYAAVIALSLLIVRYTDESKSRWHAAARLLYPAVLFTFFYRETGGVMFLVWPGFFDWQLTTFEKMIFGVHPTIYIDRNLLSAWANEIFSFSYFSYYLMLPGVILPLFFLRDDDVLKKLLTATCLTFFISYILFFAYPVEGPRWFFAADYLHEIKSPVFRHLVNIVIARGAVRGGCMPSSHVAVALTLLMFMLKYYRKFGLVLLPLNIGLAVGTFWGRFHYVSDVFVGAAVGTFSVLLVWKYYDRWTEPAERSSVKGQREIEHAT